MSECIRRLNRFLAGARPPHAGGSRLRVVIGNEAADLDSMTSAILYGFFASGRSAPADGVHVPVINIPRRDFVLRTEAAYLFDALGVDAARLLFIDEIDLDTPHRNRTLGLTLVDHNILSKDQARFGDAVEAVIDHHADMGQFPRADPRDIEPVGSAATLVADRILCGAPELLDEGTATLLLGTILLDTVNLSASAGRVTARDRDVAARLGERAGGDPDALFDALRTAKFDVSNLGTEDLLRKDYKEWEAGSSRYGISSVLTPLANWVAKDPELVDGMGNYLRSRGLNCLIAMMAYTGADDAFHRELVVLAPDPALRARLLALLDDNVSGLDPMHPSDLRLAEEVDFFSQADLSVSRKKLQPVLHRFFSENASIDGGSDTFE
jgi:exopolyphosphatase